MNSNKRLVPGYEAPVYIAWSAQNRSPLIRIPAKRGDSTRVEMRNPDTSCNPYLAIAVMLKAGLDGIKNKIMPPVAVNRNIYEMTKGEMEESAIKSLPGSLEESISEFNSDPVIVGALGKHAMARFV